MIHCHLGLRKDTQHDNGLQDYDKLGLLGGIPDGDRDHALVD
jgi:hypothetical protein